MKDRYATTFHQHPIKSLVTMQIQRIDDLFNHLTFEKSAAEIIQHVKLKVIDLCEEAVANGATGVNTLLTEHAHIEDARAQVEKLELIIRNLKDQRHFTSDGVEYTRGHALSIDELKFLGF